MAQSKLMLVVSLNKETNQFQPHDHNLTAEAAADVITGLRSERIDATAIVQEQKHRTKYAQTCASCKAAAENTKAPEQAPAETPSEEEEEDFAEVGAEYDEDDG